MSVRGAQFVVVFVITLCAIVAPNVATTASSVDERVKHVIVLMLENRAFDHLFGRYPGVNGLSGFEFNLVNVSNSSSERIYVSAEAPYANMCDPDHSLPATTYKMFGPVEANTNNLTTPTMGAFVQQEWAQDGFTDQVDYCNVMQGFTPDRLPVISQLASEYAIMDHFFASHPGPTWPNRAFMLAATSSGLTETGVWYHNSRGLLFPSKTIYDQVAEAGGTWKHYYNDTPWELFLESVAHNPENVQPLTQLWEDARLGQLPDFAFINPRCGINMTTNEGSNDDHPDHDVALGEALIKAVYEALRASPQWNETLFVVTFDEHGGFYDHVGPPMDGVPPPDDSASYPDKGFTFDRLGMRIPTILVSPWIAKGTVVNAPPAAQKPTATSEYDLTSIMATTRKVLSLLNGTGPLTKRDAWSATFEHVLLTTGDAPRSSEDCPQWMPEPPAPSRPPAMEARLPINSLQRDILAAHAHRLAMPHPHHLSLQRELSIWLQDAFLQHKQGVARWKARGASPLFMVKLMILTEPHISQLWSMTPFWDGAFVTISTRINDVDYCLTNSNGTSYTVISVEPCFPVTLDVTQQWIFDSSTTTVRPVMNASLCLSNLIEADGVRDVYITPCEREPTPLRQSWGFGGTAAGATSGDKNATSLSLFNSGPYVVAVVASSGSP